jgi:NADPH-dependent F420 reductase
LIAGEECTNVDIAVLGTGAVGGALGRRWGQAGHHVYYGSRTPQDTETTKLVAKTGPDTQAGSCREAMSASQLVLLAIPWDQVRSVLEDAEDLAGKVLIDCINPLTSDLSDLEFGHTTSAAEQIAGWFPQAHVVKAFNVLSAAAMEDPHFGAERATMFYCGDHAESKRAVGQLAEQLDFHPVDCGPLRAARWLEAAAMLYVHLAIFEQWGGDCAFKMLKR